MPKISDQLAAWIRTIWPMLLGQLAAWLLAQSWAPPIIAWLADLGITIDQPKLISALGLLAGAVIYTAARWLERRTGTTRWHALARAAGRLLLSLGLHTGQPIYAQPDQRIMVVGADGMRPPR
jgi:hypothetical protein